MKRSCIIILTLFAVTLAATLVCCKSGRKMAQDTKPMFNGKDADIAFREYVSQNFIYPEELYDANVSGMLFVEYVVKKDGSVGDVKILRGVHPLLDAEAVRVISSSPKWSPGIQNGKAVDFKYQFPLRF